MKSICTAVFVIFVAAKIDAQSDSIRMLSCNTWGKPDWSRVEKHQRGPFNPYATSFREADGNIHGITPVNNEVYSDDVFVRWALADTTRLCDIKITNQAEEIVFETTANKCGVYIPFDLYREANSTMLRIEVVSHKGHFPFGQVFIVDEARRSFRKKIEAELPAAIANTTGYEKAFAVADYFIDNDKFTDALSVLESALAKEPSNENIKKKYWLTVNELFIRKNK